MSDPTKSEAPRDAYWWTPWAVLVGLVTYGLLGYLGLFSAERGGPTAADVPSPPPSAAVRPAALQAPAPSAR